MNIFKHENPNSKKPFRNGFYPLHVKEPNYLVTDYLWNSNCKESYEKFDPNYKSDGLFDEYCEYGYLDWFIKFTNNVPNLEINHINVDYVDRGISNFNAFANMIKNLFPNIETLDLDQNYSYYPKIYNMCISNDEKNLMYYQEFLNMLKTLKLKNFRFYDQQSRFINNINIEDIFEIMPNDSVYVLRSGCEKFNYCTENGLYFEQRGSKKIYLYD